MPMLRKAEKKEMLCSLLNTNRQIVISIGLSFLYLKIMIKFVYLINFLLARYTKLINEFPNQKKVEPH